MPHLTVAQQEWEEYATKLANTENSLFGDIYEKLTNDLLVDPVHQVHTRKSKVVFARDTRASGPHLIKALKASLDALHVEYIDYGILTTPMLHHMVRCHNTKNSPRPFGEASEEGYYKKMANAFKKAMYGRKIKGHLTVDCANGVGGPKLRELLNYLPDASHDGIEIKIVNDDVITPEALNSEVSGYLVSENDLLIDFASSVVPTTSKQSNVLLRHQKPPPSNDAALLMEMLIALSITSSTTTKTSICLMVTGSQLWQPISSRIKQESRASATSSRSESFRPPMLMAPLPSTFRR